MDLQDPYRTASPSSSLATLPEPIERDELPSHFGRYKVEKLLGKGGFGEVYLSRDEQLNREVAIKVPRREFFENRETVDTYLAEARTLASLDHANIVPVFDVGTEDGLCFVVSKFIEGTDLDARASTSNG